MRPDYKTTHLAGITDLTVLADIKDEFVKGPFETETKVERLRRVLAVLNNIRQFSREAAPQASPFADSIGQFNAIHFFRFAILPPDSVNRATSMQQARPLPRGEPMAAPHPGPHRLLLNVSFDGGWEPYMRVIWGPLGTLLDLIFCHCAGYPLSHASSFEQYMRWVRDNEVPGSFFYTDASTTVADRNFLMRLEALQRESGGHPDADANAAGLALPGQPPAVMPTPYAVETALRALKALAGLRPLFPPNAAEPDDDDQILRRFVSDSLHELREWIWQGLFDPGGPYEHLRAGFNEERQWLMAPRAPRAEVAPRLSFDPANVQAGIADTFKLPTAVIHGALVLLRISDVAQALQWLARAPVTKETDDIGAGVARTLALTYGGLVRLGISAPRLERLPREFIEGMEARAGVLGDLRSNHPQWWRRPLLNWPAGRAPSPLELSSVHVLVQLRTATTAADEETDGHTPLRRLLQHIGALEDNTGLSVLSVQAMKSRPPDEGQSVGRDNFGFVDGISQPRLIGVPSRSALPYSPSGRPGELMPTARAPAYWDDHVKRGELFLGYANDRGDEPGNESDDLLDDGSFLVVRKLRQHVDRLARLVDEAAERMAPHHAKEQEQLNELFRCKLLGRRSDGKPMVGIVGNGDNDFDYRSDSDGAACPFASHIRRANPREPRPRQVPPRIVRRGMSYGSPPTKDRPGGEHGLVFMAYNASIAEQFEVIQRWLAGGNSSGVCSTQSDPFVGVPEPGRRRVYRFVHEGRVLRLDLGDQPLSQLEWGMYAFVPSIAALKALPQIVKAGKGGGPSAMPEPSSPSDFDVWKQLLEDGKNRQAAWAEVRARGGVVRTSYGVLAGSPDAVLEVLKDPGGRFSVAGYGQRMEESIGDGGRGYLGQDDEGANAGHQLPYVEAVNHAIETTIPESQAYDAAYRAASEWLKDRLSQHTQTPRLAQIDLPGLGGAVIARLCFEWFGLPDGKLVDAGARSDKEHTDKPLCPGHLVAASRYVFSPHPSRDDVARIAKPQGQDFARAVEALLDAGVPAHATLTKAIVDAMQSQAAGLRARTVAGVMLGFPPTVLGNLLTVLVAWNPSRRLWDIQHELMALSTAGQLDHAHVQRTLLPVLLATMSRSPVPFMDWRTAAADTQLHGCPINAGEHVIVGLGSAVQDPSANKMLMFGGERAAGEGKTRHACPGYGIAVGTMLGCISALLTAGALRPTPDPRVLTLIG